MYKISGVCMKEILKNKIPVSISISPQLLIQIDEVIQNEESSRSDFIRTAIIEKIRKIKEG